MPSPDILQQFLFENADIRGEIITLSESYHKATSTRPYPANLTQHIGEFMAAAGLLSATLKFNGTISLQAQGNGPVSLIMADCTRHHNLRGIARFGEDTNLDESTSLDTLIGEGTLAITITPSRGERYQGLVPLDAQNLAESLEYYFRQSEQLQTRLWLASSNNSVCGLMIQRLPDAEFSAEYNQEAWQRMGDSKRVLIRYRYSVIISNGARIIPRYSFSRNVPQTGQNR